MNEEPDDALDQADEEILTTTVSDEVLEAAAGTEVRGTDSGFTAYCTPTVCIDSGL